MGEWLNTYILVFYKDMALSHPSAEQFLPNYGLFGTQLIGNKIALIVLPI